MIFRVTPGLASNPACFDPVATGRMDLHGRDGWQTMHPPAYCRAESWCRGREAIMRNVVSIRAGTIRLVS
ncbi:MAG: hypothetical protein AMXMBFR8_24010 [Nevskiales bacterium]